MCRKNKMSRRSGLPSILLFVLTIIGSKEEVAKLLFVENCRER